jgi:hypothetical protein
MDDKSKRNLAIFFLVLLFLVAVALLVVYLVKKYNDSKNSDSSDNKIPGRPMAKPASRPAASRPAASRPAARVPVSPPAASRPAARVPVSPPAASRPMGRPAARGRPSGPVNPGDQTFINQFKQIGASGLSGLPLYASYIALILNSVDPIVDPDNGIKVDPPSLEDASKLSASVSGLSDDFSFAVSLEQYAMALYNYFGTGSGVTNLKKNWATSVNNLLNTVGCTGDLGSMLSNTLADIGEARTKLGSGGAMAAVKVLDEHRDDIENFGMGVHNCYKNFSNGSGSAPMEGYHGSGSAPMEGYHGSGSAPMEGYHCSNGSGSAPMEGYHCSNGSGSAPMEGYRYIQNNSCGCGC